jgi:HlyD family secretion protein
MARTLLYAIRTRRKKQSHMDTPISAQTINRKRHMRLALALGSLALVVITAWGINRLVGPSVALTDLRVVEVRRGDIANTINASGVVVPVHEEQVPSPIQTRVARVDVKAGQQVAAGELLLELDDHTIKLAIEDLQEQIAQQEVRIQALTLEMQQKQKQLQSEIELLGLDLASAKVKLGRYERMQQLGATSASDLDAARLVVERAEIELRQHRESVADTGRATQTDIQGAQLQQAILLKQLEQQQQLLAQTQVRAPFAGMLTWVLADEGASVASGQMVAKVSELHNFRVEATVSDFYARYLSPGQLVRVGYSGQTLPGHVQTILPEIQNGTVTLMVALDKPNDPLLRNKLRVDANIVTEQKTGTLVADSGPAFNGKGLQDVFVIDGGVARKRQLDVGLGDGNAVEIVSGAKAGDKLIVSDVSRYKHLDSIRISN